MNYLFLVSTFFATLGCGLMAGLFFTFSNFVMKGLGNLSPVKGIAAMQSINLAVLNPLFLTIFSRDRRCLPNLNDFRDHALA